MATINGLLRTEGNRFVDRDGVPVRLRGVGLGGWMNMENFITGYAANESLMRSTVREVLGRDRYELFFDRLLTAFFGDDDAELLAGLGAEFDVFDGELDNVVYACPDYAAPGFVRGGDYPGLTNGIHVDKAALAEKFRQRTEYSRKTNTPVWVGEFGPVYTGDERRDAMRYQILADQLNIYRDDQASWSIWTYKDIGTQGIAVVKPDSAYRRRFDEFVAKKNRLGADHWGSEGSDIWPVSASAR